MYNATLAVLGRYSLLTLSADTLGVHRLVQAVVRARLDTTGVQTWAAAAVHLLRAVFPNESWEVKRWPDCEWLLPHLLTVCEHAERDGTAGEDTG